MVTIQSTIPQEFISRVEFGNFWQHYLGESLSVTPEKLQAAKDALLDAGVPARTAVYYFIELGSMVEADQLRMVEEIQYAL